MVSTLPPALELVLVRHGQSEADLLKVIECNADFALTNTGLIQARRLAAGFADRDWNFSALYSSPLQRAQQTAALLSDALVLSVKTEPRLAEKNVGVIAGLSREEADTRYPDPPGGRLPHQAMGGGTGESLLSFKFRVHEALWELRERHGGERICVVAHGGVIDEALRLMLSSPVQVRFASGDAAWHHLRWGESVSVLGLNQSF